jgi:N-hydroxyarylamine O-acetyltransferase
MHPRDIDLDAYLERVALTGPVRPDAEGLALLQRAQLRHIPFENFDIHLGRDISLLPAELFDKLVRRRRGGYCFELNGLFARMLEAFGYRPQAYVARVIFGRGSPGPRTHQVLLVRADQRDWLVDVGFGGPGLRAPLLFEVGREDDQDTERFRLRGDEQFGYVLQKLIAEQWTDLYAFELTTTLPHDFEMANFFMSRYPESYFRLNRAAAVQRTWGRVTLLNFSLSIERGAKSMTRELAGGAEYMSALAEHFGIELEARYEDLMPIVPA